MVRTRLGGAMEAEPHGGGSSRANRADGVEGGHCGLTSACEEPSDGGAVQSGARTRQQGAGSTGAVDYVREGKPGDDGQKTQHGSPATTTAVELRVGRQRGELWTSTRPREFAHTREGDRRRRAQPWLMLGSEEQSETEVDRGREERHTVKTGSMVAIKPAYTATRA